MQEDMGGGLNAAKLAGTDRPPARVHIELQSLNKEVDYLLETVGSFGNQLMPVLNFDAVPTDPVEKDPQETAGNLISTKLRRIKMRVSKITKTVQEMQKRLEI